MSRNGYIFDVSLCSGSLNGRRDVRHTPNPVIKSLISFDGDWAAILSFASFSMVITKSIDLIRRSSSTIQQQSVVL